MGATPAAAAVAVRQGAQRGCYGLCGAGAAEARAGGAGGGEEAEGAGQGAVEEGGERKDEDGPGQTRQAERATVGQDQEADGGFLSQDREYIRRRRRRRPFYTYMAWRHGVYIYMLVELI